MGASGRWTAKEIAQFAGVTPAAVSNWRKRSPGSFPQPDDDGTFDPGQVIGWLGETGRLPATDTPAPVAPARLMAMVGGLAARSAAPHTYLRVPAKDVPAGPPPPRPSQQALDALHGAGLDDMSATAVLTGLLTAAGLGADLAGEALPAPGAVERELDLPRDSLRVALAPAADLPPGTLAAPIAFAAAAARDRRSADQQVRRLLAADIPDRTSWEHTTTPALTDFLIDALPDSSPTLLDPACGRGGLLTAAAERLQPDRILGYETDDLSWAITALRCELGGPPASIRRRDFFSARATAHTVVAHPPMTGIIDAGTVERRLRPQLADLVRGTRGSAALAWLLACYESLEVGGTAYVVSPAGLAFARSQSDARRELVRMGALLALVSLPPSLRATPQQSARGGGSLWVLRRQVQPAPGVLLVDAATESRDSSDARTLRQAAEQVRQWCRDPASFSPVPGLSEVAPLLALVGGRAELSPSDWTSVPTAPAQALREATTSLRTMRSTSSGLSSADLPDLLLEAGRKAPPLVSLADLAREGLLEVQRPRHTSRANLAEDGPIPYAARLGSDGPAVTGRLYALPDHAVVTRPGDVVLSTIHPLRAAVDRAGGNVLGSTLWLIRPLTDDPSLSPEVLTLLLANPRIAARAVGSTVRRLREPADVEIPRLPPDDGEALRRWVRRAERAEREARAMLRAKADAFRSVSAALDTGARVSR